MLQIQKRSAIVRILRIQNDVYFVDFSYLCTYGNFTYAALFLEKRPLL